jgi:nicotinamidase-related amidase
MATLSPWLADRVDAVLVVIDVQDRLADAMPRRDEVVATTAVLVRSARVLGMPVLVTRQYPVGLGDVVAEVREALGDYTPIDKTAFCCRSDEGFSDELADTWRGQVILVGMEAHICITQTALALVEDGYRVHVVADAVCSRRDSDCEIALERLRYAGIAVTTAEAVLYEALGESGTEEFRTVLAMIKGRETA